MIGGTYQIKNIINGKRYIGKSTNIKNRWQQHRSDLRAGRHHNKQLQNEWNTYGEDNFLMELLFECSDNDTLNEKEKYYIEKFNTTNSEYGYNLTKGGDSYEIVEETREKLRGLGSKFSEEEVRQIKLALYCLMDRKEIQKQFNIKKGALEGIVSGSSFSYICPELNDSIKHLIPRLREERDATILELYDSGKTTTQIVKELGLTSSIVEKTVYKNRETKQNDKYKEIYNEVVRLKQEEGMNISQIAKKLNIGTSTVSRYLKGEVNPSKEKSYKKVKDDVLKEIISLYKSGTTRQEICEKFSLSDTTVNFYIDKYANTEVIN